jgi:hypothetical protein
MKLAMAKMNQPRATKDYLTTSSVAVITMGGITIVRQGSINRKTIVRFRAVLAEGITTEWAVRSRMIR